MLELPKWIPEKDNWYAIFSPTGEEENVKKRIEYKFADQFRVLVPKRKIRERKNGQWSVKIKTLFPGYVLINGYLDDDAYYGLKEIPGLIRILKSGNTILNVEKSEIEVIQKLICNKDDIIGFSKVLEVNNKIIVTEGPLASLEGLIESIDKRKGRAKVKLKFLGEPRTVDLGISVLQKI